MSSAFSLARNTVLAASAGTGKTFHLTGALVHLLTGASDLCSDGEPLDGSRIVATTFSRKAAGEIRERVVVHLELLASAPERSPYLVSLESAARRRERQFSLNTLSRHARRSLASIDRANITTLHALAHQIVRAHSLELGRTGELALTSEEDASRLTRDAIETATSKFADAHPDDAERLVTLFKGSDRLFDGVTRALGQLEELGADPSDVVVPTGDAAAILAQTRLVMEAVRPLAGDPAYADVARAAGLAFDRGDHAALGAALRVIFAARKSKKASDAAQRFFDLRETLAGKTHGERCELLLAAYECRDEAPRCASALAALVRACKVATDDAFLRAQAMSFGGVLRAARDVMLDHPAVAHDWGSRVDALLVDEFQDTSRLQRDLLLLLWQRDPLTRAAGIAPGVADLRPRGLLVVGDRKQSIYAFRGADVGVFTELCVGLAGEPARQMLRVPAELVAVPLRPSADFHALRDNYRSKPELIAFSNAFARARLRAVSTAVDEIEFSEEAEALRLPPTDDSAPHDGPRAVWLRPPIEQHKTSRVEDARVLALEIVERAQRDTSMKWRDFAVIAHSNEMLDAAAYALAQASVPYVVAGRGFYQAQEVRDLCAMLRAVARPRDALALLEVLRGPWAGASDRTLLGLTRTHAGVPTRLERWGEGERRALIVPEEWPAVERLRDALVRLRASLHRMGPGPALRAAVQELRLEETWLLMPRGEQRVANVRKFLAIADGERDAQALLRRLEWADEQSREAEAAVFSDDDDAVRLLTIHASKGLDFKVVLIPEVGAEGGRPNMLPCVLTPPRGGGAITLTTKMLDRTARAHAPPSFVAATEEERRRSLAERHRLLYVAVTRAAEHMVFVGDGRAESSLAHTLNELANDPSLRVVRRPFDAIASVSAAPRSRTIDLSAAPSLSTRARSLPIAATALRDFEACPRRFEWLHARGAIEVTSPLEGGSSALEEGAVVHKVLERIDEARFGDPEAAEAVRALVTREAHWLEPAARETLVARATAFLTSAYARRIAQSGAEIIRELPFVIEVGQEPSVALRGTIDLVVRTSAGVDVLDYKSSAHEGPAAHGVQLDAYTLAAHVLYPSLKVRAGIVALDGARSEPRFRAATDEATLRARLAKLGVGLATAQSSGRFSRVPVERCRALRCGFVHLCHARGEAPQLALF